MKLKKTMLICVSLILLCSLIACNTGNATGDASVSHTQPDATGDASVSHTQSDATDDPPVSYTQPDTESRPVDCVDTYKPHILSNDAPRGRVELLSAFSSSIDQCGLSLGMFESEMLTFVESLMYEGQPLSESGLQYICAMYDGENDEGGVVCGMVANDDSRLQFSCERNQKNRGDYVSNRFYTEYALSGLPLPQELTFGMTFDRVVSALLGEEFSYDTQFLAETDDPTDMILAHNGSSYLILRDLRRTTEPAEYRYPLQIVFAEYVDLQRDDEVIVNYWRQIILSFETDSTEKNMVSFAFTSTCTPAE